MKRHIEVIQYLCDACSKEYYADPDDGIEYVKGFHGTVQYVQEVNTEPVFANWFACSKSCIRAAVSEAVQTALEDL